MLTEGSIAGEGNSSTSWDNLIRTYHYGGSCNQQRKGEG